MLQKQTCVLCACDYEVSIYGNIMQYHHYSYIKCDSFQGLPNDIHIVCVELPGQGNTTIPIYQSEASLYKLADLLAEVKL